MKEQVQELGVRKWFGDDFIDLQNELYATIRSLVADYGNMILSGCNVTNNGDATYNISEGVAYLRDSSGANGKYCRVYAQTNVAAASFPVYLVQASRDRTAVPAYGREYKDATTKNIIVEYYANVVTSLPAHANYVSITAAGVTTRFRDAIQSANYRFATDTEKTAWNAKLNASSYTAADVLTKLLTVDTDTSGLNANTLQGYTAQQFIDMLGTGVIADADTLDGYHANAFLFASAYTAADILTKLLTVDGIGTGLDADLLDGNHAAAFATAAQGTKADAALPSASYTATDVLTKIKTVDGTGTGLDADLLDGKHAAEFATSAQGTKADNAQVASDCVSTNTANKVVKRDASGNFVAGTITVTDIIIS